MTSANRTAAPPHGTAEETEMRGWPSARPAAQPRVWLRCSDPSPAAPCAWPLEAAGPREHDRAQAGLSQCPPPLAPVFPASKTITAFTAESDGVWSSDSLVEGSRRPARPSPAAGGHRVPPQPLRGSTFLRSPGLLCPWAAGAQASRGLPHKVRKARESLQTHERPA